MLYNFWTKRDLLKEKHGKITEIFNIRRFGVTMAPLSRENKYMEAKILSSLELKINMFYNKLKNQFYQLCNIQMFSFRLVSTLQSMKQPGSSEVNWDQKTGAGRRSL